MYKAENEKFIDILLILLGNYGENGCDYIFS